MQKKQIAVIGSSNIESNSKVYQQAIDLGRKLVDNDFRILCGGLGGIMEAVCRGGKESANYSEGMTVGIVPSLDPQSVNRYVDIRIASGMSFSRNQIIVASADAVVAIAGGSGTLSEISFAWQLKKPIIALSSSGGWSEKLADKAIDSSRVDQIVAANNPEAVIKKLREIFKI